MKCFYNYGKPSFCFYQNLASCDNRQLIVRLTRKANISRKTSKLVFR